MGYSMIVLVGSVALFAWFIFAAKASVVFKSGVAGLFLLSFACLFWIRRGSLVGSFLLVALNVFIILYRTWQQAHSSGK
jgi:hypothetical protein